MFELRVTATEIPGHCPAHEPMNVGDSLTGENGDLSIPREDQHIYLSALQSIMLLTPYTQGTTLGSFL